MWSHAPSVLFKGTSLNSGIYCVSSSVSYCEYFPQYILYKTKDGNQRSVEITVIIPVLQEITVKYVFPLCKVNHLNICLKSFIWWTRWPCFCSHFSVFSLFSVFIGSWKSAPEVLNWWVEPKKSCDLTFEFESFVSRYGNKKDWKQVTGEVLMLLGTLVSRSIP